MHFQPTTSESLGRARALMRELIDRMQTDGSAGQAQAPASLLHIRVHLANIQKLVDQSSEDTANAVKRLRDFANTIERLEPSRREHGGRARHSGPVDRGPAPGGKSTRRTRRGCDQGMCIRKAQAEPRCRGSTWASIIAPLLLPGRAPPDEIHDGEQQDCPSE